MAFCLDVLVACEESQTVCRAFRELGHAAFSCDLRFCSGGHPEWHIVGNCLPLLDGYCSFDTQNGVKYSVLKKWDLIIAHPPCTYLSKVGAPSLFPNGRLDAARFEKSLLAKDFFLKFLRAGCEHIAVENPVPLKIVGLPRPSTFIEPYFFGHPFSKKTLLWLVGLPPLISTLLVPCHSSYTSTVRSALLRSKTFPGIARAMAAQWSDFIIKNC